MIEGEESIVRAKARRRRTGWNLIPNNFGTQRDTLWIFNGSQSKGRDSFECLVGVSLKIADLVHLLKSLVASAEGCSRFTWCQDFVFRDSNVEIRSDVTGDKSDTIFGIFTTILHWAWVVRKHSIQGSLVSGGEGVAADPGSPLSSGPPNRRLKC